MVHISTDTTTTPHVVGLFVHGQLDLTAVGAFRDGLTRAARISHAVEIHLDEVDFIDGCGLSMLMDAVAHARHAGYELSIADASGCVRRLIEMTDTADRLPMLLPAQEARRAQGNSALAPKALETVGTPAFRI